STTVVARWNFFSIYLTPNERNSPLKRAGDGSFFGRAPGDSFGFLRKMFFASRAGFPTKRSLIARLPD
ncbi:MAG: hypothetical protein K2K83_06385, partial [Rikenella sp.]|nr:hypothetical protein [Rikenella sp.]